MKLKALLFALLVTCALTPVHGQIVVNEFMALNEQYITDPDSASYSDWVELHNTSGQAVSLAGLYITNDPTNLTKFAIAKASDTLAAQGYLLIWLDKLNHTSHANFQLSGGDGEIALTNGVSVLSSISYGLQIPNTSYGTSQSGSLGFFAQPTPGAANTSTNQERLSKVQFSQQGGIHQQAVTVALSHPTANVEIRYTTDGSDPANGGTIYNNALNITVSTPVRAIAIGGGYINSIVATQTYLIGESTTLPIIMLSTDPDGFFSNQNGMYVQGTNGVEKFCSNGPANWNMDWERAVNFEYVKNGQTVVNKMAGASIFGGCSRTNDMKSLAIKTRNEYEGKSFDYTFFDEKPELTEIESIILRNSGNDFNESMYRDALMQRLIADHMTLEHQAYQPSVVFLNGEYWGIHNIRERISAKFIEENSKADADLIDLLEVEGSARAGDSLHYAAMMQYMRTNGLAATADYNYIQTQMDVDNYADYMLAQIYYRNEDWPGNNIRWWRPRTPEGKWRWILYDTDFGYNLWGNGPEGNTLRFVMNGLGDEWPNPAWSTELFRTLMTNDDFRGLFLDKMLAHLAVTFDPQRTAQLIDEMAAVIEPEINRHFDRWGGWAMFWGSQATDMKTFGAERPGYMVDFLASEYGYSGIIDLDVTTQTGAQTLSVNKVESGPVGFDGQFFTEQSIKLSTSALPGYRFLGWESDQAGAVVAPGTLTAVEQGANWKYNDSGISQNGYQSSSFDDSSWATGDAQLGYGDDDETTVLDFGFDPDNKPVAYYFRKTFTVTSPQSYETATLQLMVDDGALVTVNGQEVARFNLPQGELTNETLALETVGGVDESTWHEFNVPVELLVAGENLIAVEVHQAGANSSDLSFDLSMSLTETQPAGNGLYLSTSPQLTLQASTSMNIVAIFEEVPPVTGVFINEVLASNKGGIMDHTGQRADWVELYNSTNSPVNVAGLYISDVAGHLGRFRISDAQPDSTTIPANGFLRLWADNQPQQGVQHLGLKLSAIGESLVLSQYYRGDTLTLDQITFGVIPSDVSYGRFPDGSSQWQEMVLTTPGASNQVKALVTGVFINEFMSSNDWAYADNAGEFDDWIELYNSNNEPVDVGGLFISDSLGDLTLWKIPTSQPDSTTIPAGGFLVLWADKDLGQGVLHTKFSLGDAGEDIVLSQANGPTNVIIDQYSYTNQWRDVSEGRYTDGQGTWERYNDYTPGAPNKRDVSYAGLLLINEVLANSVSVVADEYGEFDDYIEVHNLSNTPIDIGGLWLTDTTGTTNYDRIASNNPDSTTIPAGGFLTLWADGQTHQGVLHLDFKLGADGEEVGLIQIIGSDTTYLDQFIFTSAEQDISTGRYPDGTSTLTNMTILTPAAPNEMDMVTAAVFNIDQAGFQVYPNPAKGQMVITLNQSIKTAEFVLVNTLGEVVIKQLVNERSTVDISALKPGVYSLVNTLQPAHVQRVIVQ